MDRGGIVDSRIDVLVPQLIYNLISLSRVYPSQTNSVQVPAMLPPIWLLRQEELACHVQFFSSEFSVLPSLFKERRQFLQLCVTNRCRNLGHVIIVTWSDSPVGSLFAMGPNHSQCLGV